MTRVCVVGAGQSGLQFALGLLAEGHRVTLVSARTPGELRAGPPVSTQAMFHDALETERALGLSLWEQGPGYDGLWFTLSAPPGERALHFHARQSHPAQSVDQRLKFATWLELAGERGADVLFRAVDVAGLESLAAGHDLTVVAAGRGPLREVFARDPRRSPYDVPQRSLALAYVDGVPLEPYVGFHAVPGVGEFFEIPGLGLGGPCLMLLWEAVPGGPADVWAGLEERAQLPAMLELARRYVPWATSLAGKPEPHGAEATFRGGVTPGVRRPVAVLGNGVPVLGMADAVVLNDPVTGQGSNTAAKCAAAYLAAVRERPEGPYDREWMTATAEGFWESTARVVTQWTNAMVSPLAPHVQSLLGAAAADPRVAHRFADAFSNPADLDGWFLSPEAARRYLASL